MRFGFNVATFLCLLILGAFVTLAPACRDADTAIVDHEHEDLVCENHETICTLEIASGRHNAGDNACIDLSNDTQHCGACNNNCGDSHICVDSQCKFDGDPLPPCKDDTIDCGSDSHRVCVDINTDPEHCGACDNACEPGMERCYAGDCVPQCSKGYSTCGAGCCHWESYCADEGTAECATLDCLIGSPCGNGCCDEDQYCGPGSICHDLCDAGETACGGGCCPPGATCVDGRCAVIQ